MRILIIEAEKNIAESIKKYLEQHGYAADCVFDAETAGRRVELYRNEYDLIILDWMLPGGSGLQICKDARKEGITTPILVLTGRSDTVDKVSALDLGADDYLVKPFSFEELLARVRALLRRPHESLPVRLQVGNLTLDTATRKVYRGKKEVDLTVKEFSLLEYFMRHPNQVLNRNQILDHLWGFDFDSFSNVVDVHIKNLRKKLKLNDTLVTIRGIGYSLKDPQDGSMERSRSLAMEY